MNVCSILCFCCWCVVQFHDTASYLIKPNLRKNQKFETISEHKKVQYNDLDLNRLMDETASSDAINEHHYSPTRLSLDLNLPIGLYESAKTGDSHDTRPNSSGNISYENRENNLNKDLHVKIADIISAARMFENNHTYPVLNQNCTQCKPLCFQNSTDFVKCCCSKDLQQKCEGVDLSYILPIPGDTTTSKTKAHPKNRPEEKNILTTLTSPATMCNNIVTKGFKSQMAHNGRGYRKVEESTLDALRKFQLTHGIFAPNEEELEKAVEKAKLQVSKVRSKLPGLLKNYRHKDAWSNDPQENYFDNRKIMKDVNELYKLLPQFKIEKIANEMRAANNPYYSDVSLLHQNAAAIKKQLETIKQYDILLANIRAQAQLRLIELADMEAKHRVQETRFKSQRKQGLEELKNMEEVLREEVKLAQNLPGASGDWNELLDSSHSNQSEVDAMNQNVGKYYQPYKDEFLQDNVNRNNKLLQYLEMLLHMNDNYNPNYNELNILSKQSHGNLLEDKLSDRFLLWRKPLEREIRNNQYTASVDSNRSNYTRNKRKCSAVKTMNTMKIVEESPILSSDYDRAFHNLQNDLLELKDQLLSQTKSKTEPQDNNVLVQIKVSVDVANTTDSSRSLRRDLTSNSDNNKEGKNKQIFQKLKAKQ